MVGCLVLHLISVIYIHLGNPWSSCRWCMVARSQVQGRHFSTYSSLYQEQQWLHVYIDLLVSCQLDRYMIRILTGWAWLPGLSLPSPCSPAAQGPPWTIQQLPSLCCGRGCSRHHPGYGFAPTSAPLEYSRDRTLNSLHDNRNIKFQTHFFLVVVCFI